MGVTSPTRFQPHFEKNLLRDGAGAVPSIQSCHGVARLPLIDVSPFVSEKNVGSVSPKAGGRGATKQKTTRFLVVGYLRTSTLNSQKTQHQYRPMWRGFSGVLISVNSHVCEDNRNHGTSGVGSLLYRNGTSDGNLTHPQPRPHIPSSAPYAPSPLPPPQRTAWCVKTRRLPSQHCTDTRNYRLKNYDHA